MSGRDSLNYRFRSLLADRRGSEIAEVAAVMPLLVMIILGIMWFGRAFNIYTTVHRAAHEAARSAVATGCATCGVSNPDAAQLLTNTVNPILAAAHLSPVIAGPDFTVTTNVPLNGTAPVEYGTEVVLKYPYMFRLNGLTCCPLALTTLTNGIVIRADAQARQEN